MPIAIACLRLETRFADRPDRSEPRFRSCIASPTSLLAPLLDFLELFFATIDASKLRRVGKSGTALDPAFCA
ncbi:MAG TPA: hypothetical protein VGL81_15905 [Polyangiaceae bacterium]